MCLFQCLIDIWDRNDKMDEVDTKKSIGGNYFEGERVGKEERCVNLFLRVHGGTS